MRRFVAMVLGIGLGSAVQAMGPSEVYQIQKGSLGFSTWVRVEIPAKVVEAEDSAILGESTTYIQSLSYTASKDQAFTGVFSSEAELRIKIQNLLCPEYHDIELRPMREGGAKGGRLFRQRIRPATVSVMGTLLANGKSKPYSASVTCLKN